MRAVVQRVSRAAVRIGERTTGEIGDGLLVLLGVHRDDTEAQAEKLAAKLVELRCFTDEAGKMNLSCRDVGGEVLVVSQFTLYGDCRKGRRPSYTDAAPPEKANALYECFVGHLRTLGVRQVATGEFGAMMSVSLVNEGPVTLIVDV
ncbi:MAG: D-tyrosyl-tRNA(Tyr) deacylase [Verrucomicrobia bacterium]|nr:D-tyrosyl-tRNA(Tyr) deacylase [Verrucomicrobiota bacterium]